MKVQKKQYQQKNIKNNLQKINLNTYLALFNLINLLLKTMKYFVINTMKFKTKFRNFGKQ